MKAVIFIAGTRPRPLGWGRRRPGSISPANYICAKSEFLEVSSGTPRRATLSYSHLKLWIQYVDNWGIRWGGSLLSTERYTDRWHQTFKKNNTPPNPQQLGLLLVYYLPRLPRLRPIQDTIVLYYLLASQLSSSEQFVFYFKQGGWISTKAVRDSSDVVEFWGTFQSKRWRPPSLWLSVLWLHVEAGHVTCGMVVE